MGKKDVRIHLVMSEAEVDELDTWRFAHRIGSRSEAIRRLIAEGVKADEKSGRPADGDDA